MSRFGWHIITAVICTLACLLPGQAVAAIPCPWQPCGDGLPSFAQVLTLEAAPDQPGSLWAGTNGRPGLWLSSGEDQPWQPVPASPPTYAFLWDAGRQTWWAGTAEDLLFRPDGATRWQADPVLTGPVFDLALDGSGRLYAVQGQQGLVVSSAAMEPASTWMALRDEAQALSVVTSAAGSDLYLGTAGRGLWVSHDSGGRKRSDGFRFLTAEVAEHAESIRIGLFRNGPCQALLQTLCVLGVLCGSRTSI